MYNETYDDYIRSILGYPPARGYEDSYQDYRNQNMNYNMTSNMNTTSDMDLESCYPEIYKIVYPMVCKKCDSVRMPVTNDDIQNMTDEIYNALEERNDIQVNINLTNEVRGIDTTGGGAAKTPDKKPDVRISETSEKRETRQINRNLRDLIQILLIRELLRRFRRPGMPGRPPTPRPPMPRPPMRPPFRPGFGPGGTMFNRDYEISNYDIFEN